MVSELENTISQFQDEFKYSIAEEDQLNLADYID